MVKARSIHTGTVSLILPAYNEETNLATVVHECLGVLPYHFADCEIIIVDDGSTDATPRIAAQLAADYDPVVVIEHARNRGYGSALIDGVAAARGDYVMVMDADRQFSIGDIARCMPFVDSADMIAGYRLNRSVSLYRAALRWPVDTLAPWLFGLSVRDPNCGFKLFRATVLRELQLTSSSMLINTEIFARAARNGARVVEVGVHAYPRRGGRQRSAPASTLKQLARLWWRVRVVNERNRWQPKALAGGALAAALGGLWSLWRRR